MACYIPPTTKYFNQDEHKELIENILEGHGDLSRYISYEEENETYRFNEQDEDEWSEMEALEERAVINFFEKFNDKYEDTAVNFQYCCLRQAIEYSCFAPEDERKALILYLHKDDDKFSQMVCEEFAGNSDLHSILEVAFSVLPWDLEVKTDTQGALQKAVEKWPELDVIKEYICTEQSALFILLSNNDTVGIFSKFGGDQTANDLCTMIECVGRIICPCDGMSMDTDSDDFNGRIGAQEYQQDMCNKLGNRDYDSYKADESDQLKEKIGYSKFGPPTEISGYSEKQKQSIEDTFQAIKTQSERYSEYKDCVTMAIVFNCVKPLPNEVKKRKKKYDDYDEYTDIMPIAVYVIRKCFDSPNPCRIIIDHDNRVYQSWSKYLELNKLHKCIMVFPTNGRYYNIDGKVSLQTQESPACGIDQAILQGTDIAATTVGMGTAVFLGVAAIPAITIAPLAIVAASVTGAGVGIYSMVRSSMTIHDRRKHCQSMSFANSECRGAYLNIVAGSFGFVGMGATTVVSQLAARGVNISSNIKIGLNTINALNVGNSAVAVANSGYEIVHNWKEDKNVSALSILQLSASVLFFHNAVVNFKTASVIIEDAQTSSLNNYKESLRSNRHRKSFNKLLKETIRQTGNAEKGRAEVISSLSKISSKDETFAFLTRNNKRFNKYGIKFAANNGRITLNGMSIDISNLEQLSDIKSFFSDLPPIPKQTVAQVKSATFQIGETFKSIFTLDNITLGIRCCRLYMDGKSTAEIFTTLLQHFQPVIQKKILHVTVAFFKAVPNVNWIQICHDKFSMIHTNPLFIAVHLVIRFVSLLLKEYKSAFCKRYGPSKYDKSEKTVYWLNQIMNTFVHGPNVSIHLLRKFISWVFSFVYNDLQNKKESKKQVKSETQKKECKVCNGFYYES
uniref:Uncharacterized protein n=1 Tax=Photinus pyralis TaxID=7054 RepID=A0A1Y1LM37_PHOPY